MLFHPTDLTKTTWEALDSINDMRLVLQEKAEEIGSDGLFEMKGI